MLADNNRIFKDLTSVLYELSNSEFQIVNGNYISDISASMLTINHCIFYLKNFDVISTIEKNELNKDDNTKVDLRRYFIMNFELEVSIFGDTDKSMDFARRARSFFMHNEFVKVALPTLVIGAIRKNNINSMVIENQMVTMINFTAQCSVQDEIDLQVDTIETVNKIINIE